MTEQKKNTAPDEGWPSTQTDHTPLSRLHVREINICYVEATCLFTIAAVNVPLRACLHAHTHTLIL